MSLGIFSFDLAALINGLSNFIDVSGTGSPPAAGESSLAATESVLQTVSAAGSVIGDALTAAALNSAVTSVIAAAENVKKETLTEKNEPPKAAVRVPPVNLDEETRREIERLIKSLQTSVIHNYKSTDIIDETVSRNNVANFKRRDLREFSEDQKESNEQQRKTQERKLQMLREELKKARTRNNTGV